MQGNEPCLTYVFLTRLATAMAMTPKISPAMMDSQGKPGIAGSTIGVETELVVVELTVVGVLATVNVDTAVLTTVVVSGLVVTAGSVVIALDDITLVFVLEVEEGTVVVT